MNPMAIHMGPETRQNKDAPSGDEAFLASALAKLAFIRSFETKALDLSKMEPPQIVGSMHLCAGQEAVPVAAMAALRPADKVIATYRGHGWALAAGLDPRQLMAELCHRATGINGGRAGSAYFMAPGQRFVGENSIVGAGVPLACGVAMSEQFAASGNVVVVSVGDGAMNQGSVHEGLVFAAARKLPIIIVCENNGWSEYTQTSEINRVERIARRSIGYGIEGVTVDGTDLVAVRDAIANAARRAREGAGPTIVECRVPRLWGHYNRDIEHYRSREDRANAAEKDPLAVLARRLTAAGSMTAEQVREIIQGEQESIDAIVASVLQDPPPDTADVTAHVWAAPRLAAPAVDLGEPAEMTYIAAVTAALRDELEANPAVVVYGEDLGKAGGVFGATKGLQKQFGDGRVFDTPIAESAILGSAVGSAMFGMRPIVEIMWADFMLVALDQLVNQAANVRYITRGAASVPMVVRTQQGATPGSCAQHSQSLEALLAHVPGLKVAVAATPQDAYDLIREAAADPDPCVVIEARGLYPMLGTVQRRSAGGEPGQARLHRTGKHALVVTWGPMLHRALDAADRLAGQGIEVSVLDLRWLNPMDEARLVDAARAAAGRVLIVHEAVQTGGFAGEVALRLSDRLRGHALEIERLATPDVRMPAAPVLQAALIPGPDRIAEAVARLVSRCTAAASC